MTTILIHSTDRTEYADSIDLTVDGKTRAYIRYEPSFGGRVNVCCRNASNRVWRGFGRFFDTWEDALAGYKSTEMRTAIRHAREWIECEEVAA